MDDNHNDQIPIKAYLFATLLTVGITYPLFLKRLGIEGVVKSLAFFVTVTVCLILAAGSWGVIQNQEFPTIERITQRINDLLSNEITYRTRHVLRKTWDIFGLITVIPVIIYVIAEMIVGPLSEASSTTIMAVGFTGIASCYILLLYSSPLIPDRNPLSNVLLEGEDQKVVKSVGHALAHFIFTIPAATIFFVFSMILISANTANELFRSYILCYILTLFWVSAPPLMQWLDHDPD